MFLLLCQFSRLLKDGLICCYHFLVPIFQGRVVHACSPYANSVALLSWLDNKPLLKKGGEGLRLPSSLKWVTTPAWSEMSCKVGKIYVVQPMYSILVGM